jgi:radical SAM superfamily enzyme YgiQ (UPF0313 family)
MLRIFIADLTHTYIELASGTFPLGMGYVASYIKKVLGDDVEISLFKYPSDLEEKLNSELPPDVFMYSNYVWNQNLGLAFAEEIKKIRKDTLVVAGGPNISKERYKQKNFLEENAFIDFFILGEGEIPAAEMLCKYIDNNYCIESLKKSQVRQSLSIHEGELFVGENIDRIGVKRNSSVELVSETRNSAISELDDIPSPYTNGMLDQFFDNKLYPLVETNRGCPFACTFCQQGEEYFNSVSFRKYKSVAEELEYITKKMVKNSPGVAKIEFADPNFAMFKQDLKTTECLSQLQQKYGWPKIIGCTTGKNKPGQVIDAVEKVFPNSLIIYNSIQSSNPETLVEIKRSDISLDSYKEIQTEIQSRGLRSMADVILGLPLETKESHFNAVYSLIDAGVQEFTPNQAMILKSTELEEDSSTERYGLKTKARVLPRAIGQYKINNKMAYIAEVETIAVSSNTLSFEDYLSSRILHLLAMIYHNSGVFDVVDFVLKKNKINKSKLLSLMHQRIENRDSDILVMADSFVKETKGELFDTEDECLEFYCNEDVIKRVKNAEVGGNLLWKNVGLAFFRHWENVVNEVIISLNTLLDIDKDIIDDIQTYLLARVVNISVDNFEPSVAISLETDLISNYAGVEGKNFNMTITNDRYKSLVHYKTIYNNNPNGWSLMLAQLRVHSFLREAPLEQEKRTLELNAFNAD